jgi:putative SOS response-associated peptidase YedK
MCGRFARTSSREVIVEEFCLARCVDVDLRPRYNIAPSQFVEAVISDGAERRLGPMKWGFVPSSATELTLAPINARAETVATTPLFREAFRRRRCLVVADGFYEWRKDGRRKTPHFIHLRSQQPFGFAGIWSMHRAPVGTKVATCAILTCAPNELMAPIHNRMPVILPAVARNGWLDPNAREVDLRALLVPFPPEEMEAYAVSTLVNAPRNDSPECVRPVGG